MMDNKTLPEAYSQFTNQENVSMAQCNLVHQFKEQGFPDVAFALGTTQALYIGEFLFLTQGPHAILQSLLSTNKSPIWMIAKKITLSANSFKSKSKRN
jgi:hypothetical protein